MATGNLSLWAAVVLIAFSALAIAYSMYRTSWTSEVLPTDLSDKWLSVASPEQFAEMPGYITHALLPHFIVYKERRIWQSDESYLIYTAGMSHHYREFPRIYYVRELDSVPTGSVVRVSLSRWTPGERIRYKARVSMNEYYWFGRINDMEIRELAIVEDMIARVEEVVHKPTYVAMGQGYCAIGIDVYGTRGEVDAKDFIVGLSELDAVLEQ